MDYLDFFKQKVSVKNVADTLSLWNEYCSVDDPSSQEVNAILSVVCKSSVYPKLSHHIESGLLGLLKKMEPHEVWEIMKKFCAIQAIESKEMLHFIQYLIKSKYPDNNMIEHHMAILNMKVLGPFNIIQRYETLCHLCVNNLVIHESGWGVGKILSLSYNSENVSIDFENQSTPILMSLYAASNILTPVYEGSFWWMRSVSPDKLYTQAVASPEKLLIYMVSNIGPILIKNIKELLINSVIPKQKWASWWSKTKNAINNSSVLEVITESIGDLLIISKVLQDNNNILSSPLNMPEQDPDNSSCPHHVSELLFSSNWDTLDKKTLNDNKQELLALAQNQSDTVPEFIAANILCNRAKWMTEDQVWNNIKPICISTNHIVDLYRETSNLVFAKMLLSILIKNVATIGIPTMTKIFFSIKHKLLAKLILKHSDDIPQLSHDIYDTLVYISNTKIPEYLDVFLWTIQYKHTMQKPLPAIMIQQACKIIYYLNSHKLYDPKGLRKKLYILLSQNHYKIIRDVFAISTKEEITDTLLIASKSCVFTHNELLLLKSIANAAQPSVEYLNQHESNYNLDEQEIWSTQDGYDKAFNRMKYISEHEMHELSKEIKIARSYGDLRENSEYKFSIEKRNRLQQELNNLSKQLNSVRIIDDKNISIDKVGIGVSVELASIQDNTSKVFTILGPWDIDIPNGVISFQSATASKLYGHKIGDAIELNNVKYYIKDIHPYSPKLIKVST